jgi:hypothetical protein
MKRRPFVYRGCVVSPERLGHPTLVACNHGVNRCLKTVWRATFPDQSWCRLGTKDTSRRYIDRYLRPSLTAVLRAC